MKGEGKKHKNTDRKTERYEEKKADLMWPSSVRMCVWVIGNRPPPPHPPFLRTGLGHI